MDTDLNEATLASPFEDVSPMGARDPDMSIKTYEENANVWQTRDIVSYPQNRVKFNSGSPLSCPPTLEHFRPASS